MFTSDFHVLLLTNHYVKYVIGMEKISPHCYMALPFRDQLKIIASTMCLNDNKYSGDGKYIDNFLIISYVLMYTYF
jgi:hypothetical protein